MAAPVLRTDRMCALVQHRLFCLATRAKPPPRWPHGTRQHGADACSAHGVVWNHGWGQALQPWVLPRLQPPASCRLLNGAFERFHKKFRQYLLPCVFRVAAAAGSGTGPGLSSTSTQVSGRLVAPRRAKNMKLKAHGNRACAFSSARHRGPELAASPAHMSP